jgi:methylglutaconyl-CoA hydratase
MFSSVRRLVFSSSLSHSHVFLRSFSSSSFDNLLVETRDKVLFVTLNRPAVHNCFNESVISELHKVFSSIVSPSSHRAVVLESRGSSFSSGADLNWMKKMKTLTREQNLSDSQQLHAMIQSIYSSPVPTIARIQGSAFGGGVGLIAACDVSFSVSSAKFGLTEVKLGLAPAVISQFVMNKIGFTASQRYFLSGERFSADEALRISLISGVTKDEQELDQKIQEFLKELKSAAPEAVQKTKQLVQTIHSGQLKSQREITDYCTSLIADLRVGKEGQEGLTAFLEKKKPKWMA